MVFQNSGPAEILRAVQKDNGFLDSLKSSVADIFQKTLGTQLWLQYHKWIGACCELVYYSFTTLTLRQTLGEEYTGLLMIGPNKNLPSLINRILMVSLQCLGPTVMSLLIQKFDQSVTSGFLATYLRPNLKNIVLSQMPALKAFPSFFLKLHLVTFYLGGSFYHLAKRLTGIRYILLRSWFGDTSVVQSFRILGSVIAVNIVVMLMYSFYELRKKKNEDFKDKNPEPSTKQCPLCLDRRKHPSVTPCGHLFCWNCIHESLQTNSVCPLCRHPSLPHQVVPLRNYD